MGGRGHDAEHLAQSALKRPRTVGIWLGMSAALVLFYLNFPILVIVPLSFSCEVFELSSSRLQPQCTKTFSTAPIGSTPRG